MKKALTTKQKQARRMDALNKRAKAAGWKSFSEFSTAVKNGQIKLPTRPEVLPGGDML